MQQFIDGSELGIVHVFQNILNEHPSLILIPCSKLWKHTCTCKWELTLASFQGFSTSR